MGTARIGSLVVPCDVPATRTRSRAPNGTGGAESTFRSPAGQQCYPDLVLPARGCRAGAVMIPKPPFPWDLDPDAEVAAFEALKPRLADLWSVIFPGNEEHYTSVVVPSLTLDQSELRKIPGVAFYEERLLFLLIRLRNPRAHVVYVTSQPIHPLILEYYLQFLASIPASQARARLTLLCAYDSSPRPLTEKILERPRLLLRIRAGIPDLSRAYLSVFNSTPLERKARRVPGHPAQRRRSAASAARHQVREPAGLPRGGRRLSCRCGRHSGRDRRARSALRAGEDQAGHQAGRPQVGRQLLGRRKRRLYVSEGVAKPLRHRRGDSRSDLRSPGRDPRDLFREAGPHGRDRRGIRGGKRPRVTQRAAPHQPAGSGDPRRHTRPDPGWPHGADLSGLPLPGGRRLPDGDPGGRTAGRDGPLAQGRGQPFRCGLRGPARQSRRARDGTSRPSRSTCAWEGPRIHSWPCDS